MDDELSLLDKLNQEVNDLKILGTIDSATIEILIQTQITTLQLQEQLILHIKELEKKIENKKNSGWKLW